MNQGEVFEEAKKVGLVILSEAKNLAPLEHTRMPILVILSTMLTKE